MVGPLEGFADAWGSLFITSIYNITKLQADSITSSIFLGMCIGCIILPYIAEKTKYYIGITILSGIVMIMSFAYILSGMANIEYLFGISVIIGLCSAYQVIIIVRIAMFVDKSQSSLATSVANMIIMGFGWVFHNLIGVTLQYLSSNITPYNNEHLTIAIGIIPCAIILAIIVLSIVSHNIYKSPMNK